MSEDWLKILKEKMESHEAPVPEGVWESVESSLFPAKERGPRFMPWVWAFAAAAALALGVFAGLMARTTLLHNWTKAFCI